MPKAKLRSYVVSGYLTISVTKVVMAKSRADAVAKANALGAPQLCHACDEAGTDDENAWELNGFDEPPDDCVHDVNGESV